MATRSTFASLSGSSARRAWIFSAVAVVLVIILIRSVAASFPVAAYRL